jgi:DNA repair protein RecO (recombination protein O)
LVHVLSQHHGVYAGHMAGGASRKHKALLQPGNRVIVTHRARLSDQLGAMTIEGQSRGTPDILDDPKALLGLQCAMVMTKAVLPEREPFAGAYFALEALLSVLEFDHIWPAVYVRYEAGLLEAVGYGLDLSACAVSQSRDELIYVSPKSGRAVSRAAGAPYHDKLLALPAFMLGSQGGIEAGDVARGLALTGFFLEKHIFHAVNKPLPDIRLQLFATLSA